MFKTLGGAALGVTMLAAQGCAVETASDDADSTKSVQQAACSTASGANPMLAALAVALAEEIGEIDPVRDLAGDRYQRTVKLSSTGQANCSLSGGCPNVQAILDMQNTAVNATIPRSVFDASQFREMLYAGLQQQSDWEYSRRINRQPLPEPHQLELVSVQPTGMCGGLHYVFNASKTECTSSTAGDSSSPSSASSSGSGVISCDGLPSWEPNNWQFKLNAGDEMQHNGRLYVANQNISYPNGECAPDSPASWCTAWFTDLGACGSSTAPAPAPTPNSGTDCRLERPAGIEDRLRAFGYTRGNDFLDFYANESQVAVDPSGTMNGTTKSSSGSCTAACAVYDPKYTLVGSCCTCDRKIGTFTSVSFSKTIRICK